MRLPYTVTIEGAANGLIARVGCETFVFSTVKTFMAELQNYLENPDKTVGAYRQSFPPAGVEPRGIASEKSAAYGQALDTSYLDKLAVPTPEPERDF